MGSMLAYAHIQQEYLPQSGRKASEKDSGTSKGWSCGWQRKGSELIRMIHCIVSTAQNPEIQAETLAINGLFCLLNLFLSRISNMSESGSRIDHFRCDYHIFGSQLFWSQGGKWLSQLSYGVALLKATLFQ